MAESIEEAHRRALTAIDEAVGWVPPKREAEHVERILAAHIAVSAGFLAVAQAMMPPRGQHGPRGKIEARYLAVCRRIKALGR